MTNSELAKDYMKTVEKRLLSLELLFNEKSYHSVVREAQEITELCLKAMLRQIGIEPPKWHDVGSLIIEYKNRFPKQISKNVYRIAKISKELRANRELAFYGDNDFIPSQNYTRKDAQKVIKDVTFVFKLAKKVIPKS